MLIVFSVYCGHAGKWVKTGLIFLIRCYQEISKTFLPSCCRFYPTCSMYALMLLRKYGVVEASFGIVWRLLRCHPLHQGGFDDFTNIREIKLKKRIFFQMISVALWRNFNMRKDIFLTFFFSLLVLCLYSYLFPPTPMVPQNGFEEGNGGGEKTKLDVSTSIALTEKRGALRESLGKVYPTSSYKPMRENKIATFQTENSLFLIQWDTLNAGISSLKLKQYGGVEKKYPDAVVLDGKQKIVPLGTYFLSAKNWEQYPQYLHLTKYDYAAYEWMEEFKESRSSIYSDHVKIQSSGFNGVDEQKLFRYVSSGVHKISKQYRRRRFVENSMEFKKVKMQCVAFRARFALNKDSNSKNAKFEIWKLFFLKEHDHVMDVYFHVRNLSNEVQILESNDPNAGAGFYVYWGRSLGPKSDDARMSSEQDLINVSSLRFLDSGLREEVHEENSILKIRGFKWLSMESRYLAVFLLREDSDKVWMNDSDGNDQMFGDVYLGKFQRSQGIFYDGYQKMDRGKEVVGIGFSRRAYAAGEEHEEGMSVFLGSKKRLLLSNERYQMYEFSRIRDRSWIPLIKPVEWLIEWLMFALHRWIDNFGVIIVLLALIFKIIFHPFNKKSMASMAKMRDLAPRLKEIERHYGKNPQEKQRAIMHLYKTEKINPLGGCLPLLLQLPVFYSLWQVLPSLLELKESNFLWIKDLSSPDTVMEVNLLLTNQLNVLPILMTLTSIVQSKLTPQPTLDTSDEAILRNQMMQYMLPVIFLFVFWSMPSGLVLYWTTQNILQIAQQLWLNYSLTNNSKKGIKRIATNNVVAGKKKKNIKKIRRKEQ